MTSSVLSKLGKDISQLKCNRYISVMLQQCWDDQLQLMRMFIVHVVLFGFCVANQSHARTKSYWNIKQSLAM